jgi:hypothetical protein
LRARLKNKQELFGGVVIALFGLVGIIEGRRVGIGTPSNMGSGFVPMALGIILVGLGLLMAVQWTTNASDPGTIFDGRPEWRGWSCIILGVVSFIFLGIHAGLVPAAFACVFISALGDRTVSIKGAILLAAGVTAFGVVLFYYLLGIAIPLFGAS